MGMMKNTVVAGAFALAAMAGTAGAATLTVSGGTNIVLGTNFDPLPSTGVNQGDAFTNFSGIYTGGLSVDGPARIRFTFLGKEAGFSNDAIELAGGQTLTDDTPNDFINFVQLAAGFVNFKFSTSGDGGGTIVNGGMATSAFLDLAFGTVFNGGKSVYALFGDGGGSNDNDFDDMVIRIDVAAVPVPAAGLMLLGALGGIAALRRRKA